MVINSSHINPIYEYKTNIAPPLIVKTARNKKKKKLFHSVNKLKSMNITFSSSKISIFFILFFLTNLKSYSKKVYKPEKPLIHMCSAYKRHLYNNNKKKKY